MTIKTRAKYKITKRLIILLKNKMFKKLRMLLSLSIRVAVLPWLVFDMLRANRQRIAQFASTECGNLHLFAERHISSSHYIFCIRSSSMIRYSPGQQDASPYENEIIPSRLVGLLLRSPVHIFVYENASPAHSAYLQQYQTLLQASTFRRPVFDL